MEFTKYPSLENTYRQQLIDKIVYEGKDKCFRWIVTEKIHGANFSFWCDGKTVKVASRTRFVDGEFYSCQPVINKYEQDMLTLHASLLQPNDVLAIYGELYGEGIQAGVHYGPKDFKFFEVRVNGVPSTHAISELINESYTKLSLVPVLFEGTFEEALAYEETFQSKLTPDGFEGENIAEGVVIQPHLPSWLSNGKRIVLKKKTKKFSEKKNKKPKTVIKTNGNDQALINSILEHNTTNRVNNVISKFGEVTTKDFGKILGLTIQDMLAEFENEAGLGVKRSVQGDYKHFMKQINREVSSTVREVFVTLVNN